MRKFSITVNGQAYEVEVEEVHSAMTAGVVSEVYTASAPVAAPTPATAPEAPKAAAVAAGAGEHSIDAPMPGKIIKLVASVGQAVKAGDVLLILEAMKMQNEITADADGVVKAFNVSDGQNVKVHESLVILG